jgi:Tfp pilus assembly protein PilF
MAVLAEARQLLERAIASRDADAMVRAGAAALQAGMEAEAVGPVEETARAHPRDARLWLLLGFLHRSLEDLGSSSEALAKAEELLPNDPMVAQGHACARFDAGMPASKQFARAMHLCPGDRSILLQHAGALMAEGRKEAGIAEIEQELLRDPAWIEGHSALARVRWTQAEHDKFPATFERALGAAPRNVALWHAYTQALLLAGLHETVLTVVARARAASGDHRVFDAAEAVSRSELGQLEAAEALFRRLAPLREVPLLVHYLRFLLRAGRPKEAAQLGERFASGDASNQIWPYLSVAWRLLGDAKWEWLEGHPRFIGIYDIGDQLPPLTALAERLRGLHRNIHQPLDQSVRGGTQTEGHLFARAEPEIRKLRQAIVKAVQDHVAQLPEPQPGHPLLLRRRAPIRFSGSWSVRLTGGGRHVDHVHPAGWFSSALYIALPAEAQRGPREAGWLSLGEVGDLGVDLPPIRLIQPKPGRLVLFPSTMWHGTRAFEAGERLTVAFDVKRPD